MSYRDSVHYREAQKRANLMRRARTPLGHYWQQKQCVAAIKAMIEATRTESKSAEAHDRHVVTTVTSSRPS